MKPYQLIVALIGIVTLAGCSTPYQEFGTTGGYEYKKLSADQFRIGFSGNGFTEPKQVKDFAMLRAAETTLEYGFKYFSVQSIENHSRREEVSMPTTSTTSGNATVVGNTAYYNETTTTSANNVSVFKPAIVLEIKCFKSSASGEGKLYDAEQLKQEIKKQYHIN